MNLSHNLNQVAIRAREFAHTDQHKEAARQRRLFRKAVERIESDPVLNTTFHISIAIGAVVGITVVLFLVQAGVIN
jgi:hypothetical protein